MNLETATTSFWIYFLFRQLRFCPYKGLNAVGSVPMQGPLCSRVFAQEEKEMKKKEEKKKTKEKVDKAVEEGREGEDEEERKEEKAEEKEEEGGGKSGGRNTKVPVVIYLSKIQDHLRFPGCCKRIQLSFLRSMSRNGKVVGALGSWLTFLKIIQAQQSWFSYCL